MQYVKCNTCKLYMKITDYVSDVPCCSITSEELCNLKGIICKHCGKIGL